MPRQSRIDAPGALHHIMARGIEGSSIFTNNHDRNHFLERLEKILKETETSCYAWALLPNHFHLLLRTGPTYISTVMRRLLTGYAQWYNRKHSRHGHVFQNRFKSILCQEDRYFLELVRYIHLNPLRAGLVKDIDMLSIYKYCGHSVVMGKTKNEWQDTQTVLFMFEKNLRSARRAYKAFVEKGIEKGKRNDLTGGGLLRSAGGWEGVKALRDSKVYQSNDERLLGDGDFVNQILASAEEKMKKEYAFRSSGMDLNSIADRVSEVLDINVEDIWAKGRYKRIVEARSLLCYWAVRELGISMSSLAVTLGISISAISYSVTRGEIIAKKNGFELIKNNLIT
jgi:REP element-mobilizing transposase RayT